MVAERPRQNDLVPPADLPEARPGDRSADAGRVDIDLVALAAADDLGVAGDDPDVRRPGRRTDRADDPVEDVGFESLLEDQGEREEARLGAGNDQVVDRSIDGQASDVPPGEKKRIDDVAVRCKSNAARQVDGVGKLVEDRVAEGGQDLAGDEVAHQAAAAAELQADFRHGRALLSRPYLKWMRQAPS